MYLMDDSKKKEQLSIVYISAVCAKAGILFNITKNDEDSMDATLSLNITLDDGSTYSSRIAVQLKSTSSLTQYSEDDNRIKYKLPIKNYNDLRRKSSFPMFLFLLILPEDEELWVKWSVEELILRGRMYWQHFEPGVFSGNTDSVTVSIPKTNFISIASIVTLLQRVATEEIE